MDASVPDDLLRAQSSDAPLLSEQGELMLLISRQAQRVPMSVFTAASLLSLLIWPHVPPYYTLGWMLAVVLATYLHTAFLMRMGTASDADADRNLTHAAVSFCGHGFVLAMPVIAFALVPITVGAVITIYIVGVVAATLHATAGIFRIYFPYTLITLGPTAFVWAFEPIEGVVLTDRFVFVGLVVIFLVTMLGHAKGAFGVFKESYNIRLQRDALNRQLQDALAQAESANKAKTRFLASASHDLRQPIHALSLFSGALLLRQLDPTASMIARQMDQSVQSVASLLDGLLDISRLDAGIVQYSVDAVDLRGLLALLADEFRPVAQDKGLAMVLDCPQGLAVQTDPMLLQRILRNLLSNAIKYTQEGEVRLSARATPEGCELKVSDTGPGIPDSEQRMVFEEFYQLHNPERDRVKGLGLGLAIVQRLVLLLDLRIALHSDVGKGTQVVLCIPAAASHLAAGVVAEGGPASHDPEQVSILIVDDEEPILLGMKSLLEGMGYSVITARSTDEALAGVGSRPPTMVLADFRLRGDDSGMRTIRSLRDRWPGLAAFLISGDTEPARLREAHAAGVELLHKPVGASVLARKIAEVAEHGG